ncbi:MAG: hypothetical protein KGI38_12575 [Thaumarchaeota archaeon]|nr:hypothetical protein [Nitrososphaerota archaeon]
MVEWQNWQMALGMLPMYIGFAIAFIVPPPYQSVVFLSGYIFSMLYTLFLQSIASLLAKRYHWIRGIPTSDSALWSWGRRQFQIQRRGSSPKKTDFIEGATLADGSFAIAPSGAKGIYQTYLDPLNKIKHPRYNNRGAIPLFVVRHIHPFDDLMPYEEGPVLYKGMSGRANTTWGCFDEVMPDAEELRTLEKGKAPSVVRMRNHVPFMLDDGRMCPVFEVEKAAGSYDIEKERLQAVRNKFIAPRLTR